MTEIELSQYGAIGCVLGLYAAFARKIVDRFINALELRGIEIRRRHLLPEINELPLALLMGGINFSTHLIAVTFFGAFLLYYFGPNESFGLLIQMCSALALFVSGPAMLAGIMLDRRDQGAAL